MALRSLVVMLKALPRRMPGSGALVPKGNLCSKSSARLADPVEETAKSKRYSPLCQRIKRCHEESWKQLRADQRNALLITIVTAGSMGYIVSNA